MSHVRTFGLFMKKISVVIPSYNEEKSVRLMYDRLNSVFRTHLPQYDYEIIFVDDGSTDGTLAAVRAAAAQEAGTPMSAIPWLSDSVATPQPPRVGAVGEIGPDRGGQQRHGDGDRKDRQVHRPDRPRRRARGGHEQERGDRGQRDDRAEPRRRRHRAVRDAERLGQGADLGIDSPPEAIGSLLGSPPPLAPVGRSRR